MTFEGIRKSLPRLVYYPTAAAAKIAVRTSTIRSPDDQIVLQLPYRYDVAYPDLRHGEAVFGIDDVDGRTTGFSFSIDPPSLSAYPVPTAKPDRRLALRLVVKQDGEPLDDAGLRELLSRPRELRMTVSGGRQPEVTGRVTLTSAAKEKEVVRRETAVRRIGAALLPILRAGRPRAAFQAAFAFSHEVGPKLAFSAPRTMYFPSQLQEASPP